MRLKLISLLCLCALVVAGLGIKAQLREQHVASDAIIHASSADSSASQALVLQKTSDNQADQSANASVTQTQTQTHDDIKLAINTAQAELLEKYRQQIINLASVVQKSGLNINELNEMAGDLSFDEFMKKIPADLRPHYRQFHDTIVEMQQHHQKEDGMPAEFFGRYKVTPPAWIVERHQALQKVSLPDEVAQLIERKKNESTLEDQDVQHILKLCGRGAKDCIERAFVSLIDANHALSESQQKQIEGYLL